MKQNAKAQGNKNHSLRDSTMDIDVEAGNIVLWGNTESVKSKMRESSFESHTAGDIVKNCNTAPKTRSSLRQRWAILVLSCAIMFGLYYLKKLPASLHEQLKESMPTNNFESKYQLLYTLAHVPGVVLPPFAGIAVDKFGGRICVLILSITCIAGQIISSFGVEVANWPVALAGRFIYGLGFEQLFTSNQAFLSTWFDKSELGLALGIASAASYAGYLSSFIIGPIAANKVSTSLAFWIGTIIKSVSVVAAICIFALDSYTERNQLVIRHISSSQDEVEAQCTQTPSEGGAMQKLTPMSNIDGAIESGAPDHNVETTSQVDSRGANHPIKIDEHGCQKILSNFSISFWLICVSTLLVYSVGDCLIANTGSGLMLERNLFAKPPDACSLKYIDQCSSGYLLPEDGNPIIMCPANRYMSTYAPPLPKSLNISDHADPSWEHSAYIFDPLLRSNVDCSDGFFSVACTQKYCSERDKATEKAGLLLTVPYLITMVTAPIFGRIGVDRLGWRAEMICIAPLLLTIAHVIMAFQQQTSLLLPLVIHGIGYSISVSSLCPSIPLVVRSSLTGTSFGLYTCVQNIGLAFVPLIVASIYNTAGQRYLPEVEMLAITLSGAGVLVGSTLIYCDRKSGGRLRTRQFTSAGEEESQVPQIPEPSDEDYKNKVER